MEELAKIITIISSHVEINRVSILGGSNHKSSEARKILCYVIKDGFPHLMKVLCESANISLSAVYKAADSAEMWINNDLSFRRFVNRIRHDLSLPYVKGITRKEKSKSNKTGGRTKRVVQNIPISQQIFGFKWEDSERVRMWNVERDSIDFMRKYCSIGIQPIAEGLVMTRQNSSRWYHK